MVGKMHSAGGMDAAFKVTTTFFIHIKMDATFTVTIISFFNHVGMDPAFKGILQKLQISDISFRRWQITRIQKNFFILMKNNRDN